MADSPIAPSADTITRLANALLPHVVPLFAVPKGKRPTLVGTALLVADEEALFAISARHVLDQGLPPGRLYFYDKTQSLRQLSGTMLRTAPLPGGSSLDLFDVAVMRLPPGTPPVFLETLKYAMPIQNLLPFRSRRDEHEYLVTGFPRSRSQSNPVNHQLRSQPQAFRVVSASADAYTSLGLSPAQHLVMNLNIDAMRFPDGSTRRIPDPHGMSGSPIWLLYDKSGNDNNSAYTPVVGIATEYHKSLKLLVATDIGVAIDLIQLSAA